MYYIMICFQGLMAEAVADDVVRAGGATSKEKKAVPLHVSFPLHVSKAPLGF
jgi:hypothetical protein